MISAGSDGLIVVWNIEKGSFLKCKNIHKEHKIFYFEFIPHTYLCLSSDDECNLKVWNFLTLEIISEMNLWSSGTRLAFDSIFESSNADCHRLEILPLLISFK